MIFSGAKRAFAVKRKTFSLISQVLSFRLKEQASKNLVDTTINSEHPHYLFKLIPIKSSDYITTKMYNMPLFKARHTFLKNSFFPSTIIKWNKLDHNIRNSNSFNIFRKSILKFIRPSVNNLFNSHNPKGIKFITKLRLGLSHLR